MVRIEIHPILLNPRIFILQRQGAGKWGWGWGLTGTPIDMSSFYLQNDFLLSFELRRHTETTLHYGHLHDNKCKKKITRPDFLSQQIHRGNRAFFLMKRLLRNLLQGKVVLLHYASFYAKYARPHARTDDFLFFFFSARKKKLSWPRKRIW